jgi:fumarate reductase subunit C
MPAWLDAVQGASGLVLVLFMWAHMLLVSSILLGKDAMYRVARFLEGDYIFGRPYPLLVSAIAVGIFLVMVVHAVIAIRRIPASWREYSVFLRHARGLRHADTWLWLLQVVTGLLLMFLASTHLYQMALHPGDIGPYESADRFVTGGMAPLYAVLLFAVELHAGIGLYRLVLKWGLLPVAADPRVQRARLSRLEWSITGFFLVLGIATFAAYLKLGIEHRAQAGERYVPAAVQVESTQGGAH